MYNQTKKIERNCRMCGLQLPPISRYDTDGCGMCWRATGEAEHHRYYLLRKPQKNESKGITYYEEVQSLRGLFAFSEENKPLIQKEMKKEREKLSRSANSKRKCQNCYWLGQKHHTSFLRIKLYARTNNL